LIEDLEHFLACAILQEFAVHIETFNRFGTSRSRPKIQWSVLGRIIFTRFCFRDDNVLHLKADEDGKGFVVTQLT
jgi:hypothetical protein